jgi:hypothetical protein
MVFNSVGIFLKLRIRRFLLSQPGMTATGQELLRTLPDTVSAELLKDVVNQCVLEGLISLSSQGEKVTWHEEAVGLTEVFYG